MSFLRKQESGGGAICAERVALIDTERIPRPQGWEMRDCCFQGRGKAFGSPVGDRPSALVPLLCILQLMIVEGRPDIVFPSPPVRVLQNPV